MKNAVDISGAVGQGRLSKLRRLARRGEWLAIISMIVVASYAGFLLLHPSALNDFLATKMPPGVSATPSQTGVLLAALAILISIAIFEWALWEARCLFRLFGHNRAFDAAVPPRMVRLGRLALATAVAGVMTRTIIVGAMTMTAPPGHRMLSISIGTGELASAIVGFLLFTFAHVMNEAIRIEDENQGFI